MREKNLQHANAIIHCKLSKSGTAPAWATILNSAATVKYFAFKKLIFDNLQFNIVTVKWSSYLLVKVMQEFTQVMTIPGGLLI